MTDKEAISNLTHIYGIVSSDIQRSLDVAIKALEERPQGEFAKMLNERISESVCKYCQMNKHCELCEISRVFMIIDLTDKEMKECKAVKV